MPDGIVMDVIHVPAPIFFVTDSMFPESALPYRAFISGIGDRL